MAQTRLKQLREEAVMTVHELAEASGVSDDTISKIENDQRVARPSTLRKLASALGVSPQELRRSAKAMEPALPKGSAPETGLTEGIKDFLRFPDAAFWAATLEANAEAAEYTLERGNYDLKSIWHLERQIVELYGAYRRTVRRRLFEQCSPRQREALEQAQERLRAARRAVREAAQRRREQAEREKELSPTEFAKLDERIRARDERLALVEDASKSA